MMPHCGSLVDMPLDALRSWLGLGAADAQESGPLRDTLEALDHLDPDRAKYLASFAYLMGRIAHADRHVSPEETRTMEALVAEHGQIPPDQAMLVVQLAKTNNRLFGATADFLVAREFAALASYEQKLALMRCLFALAATDQSISTTEEGELHKVANELKIDRQDLVALRVEHQRHLPGLSGKG
jgi:uncharacterized tellurite resistance protein B-like protein